MINIGLFSLIKSQRILSEIPDVSKKFLNLVIHSLINERTKEAKNLKRKNKKEIKENFLNEEIFYSSEDSESEENFDNKIFIKKNILNEEEEEQNEEFKVIFLLLILG